jgi:hypothetical protein
VKKFMPTQSLMYGKVLRASKHERKGSEMESFYWSSQATHYYMKRKEEDL